MPEDKRGNEPELFEEEKIMLWYGWSYKIAKGVWLNISRSGPSITRSLGHGARINYSPKRGLSFRFSKKFPKLW